MGARRGLIACISRDTLGSFAQQQGFEMKRPALPKNAAVCPKTPAAAGRAGGVGAGAGPSCPRGSAGDLVLRQSTHLKAERLDLLRCQRLFSVGLGQVGLAR